MKYFLDTEFIEDGKTIDLISVGIVAEDGREFYKQNAECNFGKANEWVQQNVLAHLKDFDAATLTPIIQTGGPWASRRDIADGMRAFVFAPEMRPVFWGYYADYDWVAICQLFGTMMHLPQGFPMYCRDLKQLCDSMGNPTLPEQGKGEHHALADAKWNKLAYEFLRTQVYRPEVL
jgi:hypothetical protein